MAKKKLKKRIKMSKFERLLYIFAITLLVTLPVAIVFSKATLSQITLK